MCSPNLLPKLPHPLVALNLVHFSIINPLSVPVCIACPSQSQATFFPLKTSPTNHSQNLSNSGQPQQPTGFHSSPRLFHSHTFSSSALWCSKRDFRALSTSTSEETPPGDWAWRFTTVMRSDLSCLDTRHSRCSKRSYRDRAPGQRKEAREEKQGRRKGGSDRRGGHMEKEGEPSKGVKSATGQENRDIRGTSGVKEGVEWYRKRDRYGGETEEDMKEGGDQKGSTKKWGQGGEDRKVRCGKKMDQAASPEASPTPLRSRPQHPSPACCSSPLSALQSLPPAPAAAPDINSAPSSEPQTPVQM